VELQKKKHEKESFDSKDMNFSLTARRVHNVLFVIIGNLLLSRLNVILILLK